MKKNENFQIYNFFDLKCLHVYIYIFTYMHDFLLGASVFMSLKKKSFLFGFYFCLNKIN
jgi:hypothetical protein